MIPLEAITEIALLGLTPSQAQAVARILKQVEAATEAVAKSAIDQRRENDRDRKQRQRDHVKSRDVTGTDGTAVTEPPKVFPLRENQTPFPNPPSSLRSDFNGREAFCEKAWKAIPHRKGDSFKPFRKALLKALADGADQLEITNGIAAYARSELNADPQYRKGAAAWINDHKWTSDWSEPARPPPTPRPGSGGGWATLMAESMRERNDGERSNLQNVPVLSICDKDGPRPSGNDDGGIFGDSLKLLVGGSLQRMRDA